MKEIGGYIEFEHYRGTLFHDGAIKINSGRACLEYAIKAYGIRKIWLPKYICDVIFQKCIELDVEVGWYEIEKDFLIRRPDMGAEDWIYVINYYGQMQSKDVEQIKEWHTNIICDYTQAFFQKPVNGIPTIYTCRKYFGVSDGAFLYIDKELNDNLEQDISFERMNHLLGRFEKSGTEFYAEYTHNEDLLSSQSMKKMSFLTENLLRGIDYSYVSTTRTRNWKYLHERLAESNRLTLKQVEGAFAYPYFIKNGQEIRQKLIKERIYVPILWPNVLDKSNESSQEYDYAINILPLPVDQRYSEQDMERIVKALS